MKINIFLIFGNELVFYFIGNYVSGLAKSKPGGLVLFIKLY